MDPDRSFGFTQMTRPQTGVYCLTLDPEIPAAEVGAVVTVDRNLSAGGNNTYFFAEAVIDPPGGCGANTIRVDTRKLAAGGETVPNPEMANDISFTVAVP